MKDQANIPGFSSQGNEFSTYMLLTSNFMLNHSDSPFAHSIFPYLHSYSNHKTVEHHLLKRVLIPDVLPSEVLEGKGGEFSLVAGDFEEIYGSDDLTEDGSEGQKGKWASVVTCFFIDCVSRYTPVYPAHYNQDAWCLR